MMLSIKTFKTEPAGLHFWMLTAGLPGAGALSGAREASAVVCSVVTRSENDLYVITSSDELVPGPMMRCDLKTSFNGHESNPSRCN